MEKVTEVVVWVRLLLEMPLKICYQKNFCPFLNYLHFQTDVGLHFFIALLTSVVLPLASGQCNACVLFVPGEEASESNTAVGLNGASQHVKLRATWTHYGTGTSEVDEEPLLEKMLGVIRHQRSLTYKLNPALNLKFWLSRGKAMTMNFGSHSCAEKKKIKIWKK